MPGMELAFRCPCGFRRDNVSVGATQTGHYLVVLCLHCHRLFSLWRRTRSSERQDDRPICRGCGKPLIPITAPGAWGPPSLQNRFPDLEPWLVQEDDDIVENAARPARAELDAIRVLCPKCKSLSLEYQRVGLWD